ncbi:uncharacterized protein DS421_5g146450 [Arachis hypogaea]|nr:uncharacterized protein DS421_5g146450 [Arachis hypogaea]
MGKREEEEERSGGREIKKRKKIKKKKGMKERKKETGKGDPREGSAGGGVVPSSRIAAAAASCCLRRRRRPGSCRFCSPSLHRPRREVRRRCCRCQRRRPWVRQRREIREEGRIGTCPATAHSCRSYRRPSSSNSPPSKLLAATSGRTSAAGERCCHGKPPLKPVYVRNCRRNPCLLGLGSGICASKLRLLLNHRRFGECRSCRLIGSEGHCCFVSRGEKSVVAAILDAAVDIV